MIALAEKARRIPTGLLLAIAQTESGRYQAGQTLAKAMAMDCFKRTNTQ